MESQRLLSAVMLLECFCFGFCFFFLVIMTMRFPDWRFFHLSSCVIFDTWVFLYLLLTLVIMEGGTVGLQTAGYAPNKLNFI